MWLLSSCSLFSNRDNTEPPAPLVELTSPFLLTTQWTANAGGGVGDKGFFKIAPAVHDGRLFTASPNGKVTAFNLENGHIIWQQKLTLTIAGGPGVGEGLVLIGGSDGEVVALAETDGHLQWQTQVSSEVLVAPRANEGIIIVRSVDGKLFALESQTGKRLWVFERPVPTLSLRGTGTPVVEMGLVIAGFDNGKLAALELPTGKLEWELEVATPHGRTDLERMVDVDAEPILQDSIIYVTGYHGRTLAVEVGTGQLIWERNTSSNIGLEVDSQSVYLSDSQSYLWAFQRESGASQWQQTKLQARNITAPVKMGKYLIVGDQEGYLHWLKHDDGALVAQHHVSNASILVPPLVINDTLLVVYDSRGEIVVLKPEAPS